MIQVSLKPAIGSLVMGGVAYLVYTCYKKLLYEKDKHYEKILRFKEIDYVMLYPEHFTENEKYPLLFYIHGAGGRGRNIDLIYNHSFFYEADKYNLNVVSVAPQCYEDSWFSTFEQLQEFVVFAINQEFIDKERAYVMGASMGGYTIWQLAMSRPELFAAIVPICGGGMYWNAARLQHMAFGHFMAVMMLLRIRRKAVKWSSR